MKIKQSQVYAWLAVFAWIGAWTILWRWEIEVGTALLVFAVGWIANAIEEHNKEEAKEKVNDTNQTH